MESLEVVRHPTAERFLARAGEWLCAREAEHNLILGLCDRLVAHTETLHSDVYLGTVERSDSVVAAALMTPPHKLVLAHSDLPACAEAIANDLASAPFQVPGVFGSPAEVAAFSQRWKELGQGEATLRETQGIYELRQVIEPRPSPGALRQAKSPELELLTQWRIDFARETQVPEDPEASRQATEFHLQQGGLYVWDDGRPVSMAAASRNTPRGTSIGPVYTPPAFRNRGYATCLVAALSQHLLDVGRDFCCLFTQMANPTSNAIYQRIGYRLVAEWSDLVVGQP